MKTQELTSRWLKKLILWAMALCGSAAGQGTIVTIAGTDWVFPRDSRSAAELPLGSVEGVAIDGKGNLFIADSSNHLVLKVDLRDGSTAVVAGNGASISSGDGGPAARAGLSGPTDVAADNAGNLYIAEPDRIRRVTADGVISTVAGGGKLAPVEAEGGHASQARLVGVGGISLDSAGNLYFAEYWTNLVRRVGADGTLTTVAGNGTRGFSGDGGAATKAELGSPTGVAVDAASNVYIADNLNNRVRRVDTNGVITTFAGGGSDLSDDISPTQARLAQPQRLAVDAAGSVYVGGYFTTVRKISAGGVIATVAGSYWSPLGFSGDGGPAVEATVAWPRGVAIDAAGDVYFADLGNGRVRRVAADGTISTAAGNGRYRFIVDGTAATSATLTNPGGVTLDAAGNVFVADSGHSQILKVTSNGLIEHVAGAATPGGDSSRALTRWISDPEHLFVDAASVLYVADANGGRVLRTTPDGSIESVAGTGGFAFTGDGGLAVAASLGLPRAIVMDAAGNAYIADYGNHRIRKVSAGRIETIAGDGKSRFAGDGGPATGASLSYPSDIAVDVAGNLYIADTGNCRVRKIHLGGTISTVAGDGRCRLFGDGGPAAAASLSSPAGIAIDIGGDLYIADWGNNRIRKVTPDGMISTVAGNGHAAFAGDGGAATLASLNHPRGVAVDAAGNLYIADSGNDRIRLVRSLGGATSSGK